MSISPFTGGRQSPEGRPKNPTSRTSNCAAAILRNHVRLEEDGDARAEAISGAEVVSDTPVRAQRLACAACSGCAVLNSFREVSSSTCLSTGSCELTWADMHREQYRDEDGALTIDQVPCGGFECSAVVKLDTESGTPVTQGVCTVDRKGEEWHTIGRELLNNMPLTDTAGTDRIERFDGVPLTGQE